MRLSAIVLLVSALLLVGHRADAAFGRDKGPKAVKAPFGELTRPQKVKRVAVKIAKGAGISVGLLAATVLIPHGLAELQGTAEITDHHQLWQLPATFGAYGTYRLAKWGVQERLAKLRGGKDATKVGQAEAAVAP